MGCSLVSIAIPNQAVPNDERRLHVRVSLLAARTCGVVAICCGDALRSNVEAMAVLRRRARAKQNRCSDERWQSSLRRGQPTSSRRMSCFSKLPRGVATQRRCYRSPKSAANERARCMKIHLPVMKVSPKFDMRIQNQSSRHVAFRMAAGPRYNVVCIRILSICDFRFF